MNSADPPEGTNQMNVSRFIRNNLTYYWKKNLLFAMGIAISAAVLTGALIVGDSVDYSLNRIVDHRLGEVTHVLKAGDRYFTRGLTERVGEQLQVPVTSLLLQEGIAVADGGQKRINQIQVLGVDQAFDQMAGVEDYFSLLSGDSIIISRNLANRLNLSTGEEVLLRIQKASLIPLNAPFVSDAESVVPFRAVIKDIADEEQMGRFNLKVSQTSPFNVFVAQSRLRELMDFIGGVNIMLIRADDGMNTDQIRSIIREQFSALDAGLNMVSSEGPGFIEITSDRVFIDDVLTEPLQNASESAVGSLTYFVNQFTSTEGTTPYSFVSTLPDQWLRSNEIMINTWLANDLSAGVGDTIGVSYFRVGPLRELTEESTTFVVKSIVPMEGRFGDSSLMPNLPGLSDAGNCRDWDTGVPIELESIRDKDEDYWDQYGGTPKAFISISKGMEMWKNRFGSYTAFRYDAHMEDMASLEASLLKNFDPASLGFTLESTRTKGFEAAGGGVDFSELFGGLSFFLLVAGILLTVLLFLMNIESREAQLKTLVFMGIPVKIIRRIMLIESMMVALTGSAAGVGLAIFYNRMVFQALNGVWRDVIRTDMMHIDIRGATLLTGLALSMMISFLALYFPLNRMLKRQFSLHQEDGSRKLKFKGLHQRTLAVAYILPGIVALGLIGSQLIRGEVVNASLFFAAGGLLLVSAVFFFIWYLGRLRQSVSTELHLVRLSWKNALRNRTRSISIVILFAIGAFLVVSTGSNRKDLFSNSEELSSGTGGFLYYAESTVPFLFQLSDPGVKYEFGLGEGYSFVQFRKAAGDDASCLNLNKIINPQVLGVDPGMLEGRYSFVTSTEYLEEEQPWSSLEQELPGGVIPAIMDETAIKWGLGLKVGDTLHYVNSNGGTMELLLIGGLAPSVFQGNVIISNNRFLEQFPESSGTHVFLVEGAMSDTALIRSEIGRGLRDLGWDMQLTATRLAEFNSVTNTYLSIFLVMGALGLLVGTFGLVVVLSRSVMERKQEIALLKAVGYRRRSIRKLITTEYMILLLTGIGAGFMAAIVATLPAIVSPNTGVSFFSIALWLCILVVNGWIWIHLITRLALKETTIYTSLRNE
ncbi:MAG: ABC transporter permease [Bacteroidota bacterium]